jgi:ABC-type lipoprotein export system ATPase subunit
MQPIVQINDLRFSFAGTSFRLHVDELSVQPGESVALIGPSGSGKTTLLHLLAGIRLPATGCLVVDGVDVGSLDDVSRRDFRIRRIGLVFQEFELLEHLSVLDNILLSYRISPALELSKEVVDRALELADSVGISDKTKRDVGRLSQGERQRVAVCRALVTEPRLVFADEPTGNLDPDNKWKVLQILLDDARWRQSTLITVTHDHELLDRFDRVIDFADFHDRAESHANATEVPK